MNPEAIELVSNFQLTFDQVHFHEFREGMIRILSPIAIDTFAMPRTETPRNLLRALRTRAREKSWPQECHVAGFEDSETSDLLFFALPAAVYRKIVSLCRPQTVLVFKFKLDQGRTLKRYLRCGISSFYFVRQHGLHLETVIFKNRMKIDSPEMDSDWTKETELRQKWSFRENEIREMRECRIEFLQGAEADYVWDRFVLNDHARVRRDALDGNPAAMIALTEHFKESEDWYHAAALLGEKRAQKILKWQNGGFNFGIGVKDNRLTILKPHPAYPLRRGKILLSIDGHPVKSPVDVSRFIRLMPPTGEVCLGFSDGEKVFCKLLPKP